MGENNKPQETQKVVLASSIFEEKGPAAKPKGKPKSEYHENYY